MGASSHAIRTARLVLEPLSVRHADTMAERFMDARLWTYTPRLRPADVTAVRARFLRWSAGPGDVDEGTAWENWVGIRHDTGDAIGTFQATIMGDEPTALAYLVFPECWRHGYGLEAMRAVVDHLHSQHGVRRVIAEMDARNVASIALAARLGLHEVAREHVDDERTGAYGTELRYEGPTPSR